MRDGLKGWCWKKAVHYGRPVVRPISSRLFRLAQALIFGALAGFWAVFCGSWSGCLADLGGLHLVGWVLTTAG